MSSRTRHTSESPGISRRTALILGGAGLGLAGGAALAGTATATPRPTRPGPVDTLLYNGKLTTLDDANPSASALAIAGESIVAVGTDAEVRALASGSTRQYDLRGRRVVPGLNDSHTHLIRSGVTYTNELSLTRVRSLSEAMRLIRYQAERTPAPQWIRAVGFTRFQFAEKRLPTLAEINAAVPDKPLLMLQLYDRALLNRVALALLGIDKNTPDPEGGQIERDSRGNPTGMLIATPKATLLYNTLAKLPKLDPEGELVSTRHYFRHLNARGVTSAMDAAGGGSVYPDSYGVVRKLHDAGELTVRIGYHLYAQTPGHEAADFQRLNNLVSPGDGDNYLRMLGAGEMLVFAGADYGNFNQPRPELPPAMESNLAAVLKFLQAEKWPWRLHATYDESITRFLHVMESAYGSEGPGVPFIIDHAETVTEANIERIARLGGAVSAQHRMAFQGEVMRQRYGRAVASYASPIRKIVSAGIPVGLGTDSTVVASDNLWNVLYWFTTGRTVGGCEITAPDNRLTRVEALRHLTHGSARLSHEEKTKGILQRGYLADLAVLSDDYFAVESSAIPHISSVLTMVGGRIVHAAAEHAALNPALPPVQPSYSPLLTGTDRS